MNQLHLHLALARRSDPATSHRAASKVDEFRSTHEGKIYGALLDAGEHGATYREIAQRTGMEGVAVARRLGGMELRRTVVRDKIGERDGRNVYRERDGCAVWFAA